MTITLQQIADEAGVNSATVSRVLNGRTKENRPAIAKRAAEIRRIAREMGYRPNTAARSVSDGRFAQTAFVTCGDLGFDWFAPELLHGIHERLDELRQRLVVSEMTGPQLADPDKLPRLLREAAVDGMLLNIDAKLPRRIVDTFDAQPIPAVMLNKKLRARCVYPDEYQGGRVATRHLIAEGRRRIGFVYLLPFDRSPHFSRIDRVMGYRDELADAGLVASAVLEGADGFENSTGNGMHAVAAFLGRHPKLDAVLCYSMQEAGIMQLAAARRGLAVPDDLRVMVFNHQPAHALTGIPMDTAMIPFKRVGVVAVDLLQAMIDGGEGQRPRAVKVPYETLYDAGRGTGVAVGGGVSGEPDKRDRGYRR